jgi:hypothetical protein
VLIFNSIYVPSQTFGAEFTKEYLKNRLDEPIDVHVWRMISRKPKILTMKMAARSNNAILTTGWDKLVKRFFLKENIIVMFCFDERKDGKLHLLIDPVPGGPSVS